MQRLDCESDIVAGPEDRLGSRTDPNILVVAKIVERRRKIGAGRLKRPLGEGAGDLEDVGEAKRSRIRRILPLRDGLMARRD